MNKESNSKDPETLVRIVKNIENIKLDRETKKTDKGITQIERNMILSSDEISGGVYMKTLSYLPTGFSDISSCVLSFDYTGTDGKPMIYLTGSHTFYVTGTRFMAGDKQLDTGDVIDATGMYYVYYDDTPELLVSADWPGFYDNALVATIYWNSVTSKALVAEERHGMTMPAITHEYLHETVGTRYASGLTGTFGDTTFLITEGVIYDEDIKFDIDEATICDILYKDGSADYKWQINQPVYYYKSGANIYYNNGNTLTAMDANKYVAYWIFATTGIGRPIVALMGQRQDTTIADARANNKYESLVLGTLPFKEMKLLYRVILRNDATPYEEIQDLRSISNLPAGTYLATDHGVLSGLTDDDHPQYIRHALATAINDFLVASGSGAFIKKTLAETKTILGFDDVVTFRDGFLVENWVVNPGASGCAWLSDIASDGSIGNTIGRAELYTGTTANNITALYADWVPYSFGNTAQLLWNIQVGSVSLADSEVRMGVWAGGTSRAGMPSLTAAHVGFKIINGDLYATSCDGVNAENSTDLSVSISAAYASKELYIKILASSIEFYVDDVLKATHSTNLPSFSNLLIYCGIMTTNTTAKYFWSKTLIYNMR